jgi:hypothetical protein
MRYATLTAAAAAAGFALFCTSLPSPAASTATCQEQLTHDQDGNIISSVDRDAPAILAGLRDEGIDALSVEGWSGCVRAEVRQPNGSTRTEFFDPSSLARLTTSG